SLYRVPADGTFTPAPLAPLQPPEMAPFLAAPDILVRELSLVADLGSAPNRAPQPWDIQCTLDLCEFAWPLRLCHTHCGRGVYELAPVHRIGPDYAARAHRLEHDSSADSHDILYPLASIERLHIFSVRA